MLCKRRRVDDIFTGSKRAKMSSDIRLKRLCGKRKLAYLDTNENRKIARNENKKITLNENRTNEVQDTCPYLVISEIEDDQKIKKNVWQDDLYGPEPRNHYARNYYATIIQRICKGWLVRKKNSEKDTENLIKIMSSVRL